MLVARLDIGGVLVRFVIYFFLLTPFSDLLPFLWCAVIFEAVGLPADDVDIAFDVAKRGDELVQAW